MNILRKISLNLYAVISLVCTPVYAVDHFSHLNEIPDDSLREIAGMALLMNIEHLMNNNLKQLKTAELTVNLYDENQKKGNNVEKNFLNGLIDTAQFGTVNFGSLIQGNQITLQLKSVHIDRLEMDMTIDGLVNAIEPLNMSRSALSTKLYK